MKYETTYKQDANAKQQEQLLGYWVKQFGITSKDLNNHPQIEDLMLLIRWKAEFYHDSKSKHKRFFENTWNWVYYNKRALKEKQLSSLGYFAEGIIRHRQNIHNKTQAQRQIIKAQRTKA